MLGFWKYGLCAIPRFALIVWEKGKLRHLSEGKKEGCREQAEI
jgi:hypothetical protein